ncbi:universal stress protein [Paralcaligenes ureilyticus]|uniref:Nucleotide-binding universal stress UspA family protein n=1 Tax=Paralcaligenes ureilyticus TaxID=627131 RepID=A0A4R3MA91_9BURK|nr:universal stress protein [Paralcaligenes ureilyticus]TCT10136.1 nucleotide-binding universal stress UspA family protein [Paralcaligenes ureilyticus]
MYKKILVAIDGSDVANGAFETALQLAKAEKAELLPLYVVEYPNIYDPGIGYDLTPIYEALRAEGDRVAAEADACLKKEGIDGKARVADKFPSIRPTASQIQDVADEFQADLVILGTHGRSGFKRLMLGSVAEAFIRQSTRPVLLIPQKATVEPLAKE